MLYRQAEAHLRRAADQATTGVSLSVCSWRCILVCFWQTQLGASSCNRGRTGARLSQPGGMQVALLGNSSSEFNSKDGSTSADQVLCGTRACQRMDHQ